MSKRYLVPIVYIIFLMLPIYWLVNMSFKTTNEIINRFSLYPHEFTLASYRTIFTDPSWYGAYINSITYVALNTVISVALALPAAYAFSRYRFLGRQAPVLLAPVEPHGAARRVRAALHPALFIGRPF